MHDKNPNFRYSTPMKPKSLILFRRNIKDVNDNEDISLQISQALKGDFSDYSKDEIRSLENTVSIEDKVNLESKFESFKSKERSLDIKEKSAESKSRSLERKEKCVDDRRRSFQKKISVEGMNSIDIDETNALIRNETNALIRNGLLGKYSKEEQGRNKEQIFINEPLEIDKHELNINQINKYKIEEKEVKNEIPVFDRLVENTSKYEFIKTPLLKSPKIDEMRNLKQSNNHNECISNTKQSDNPISNPRSYKKNLKLMIISELDKLDQYKLKYKTILTNYNKIDTELTNLKKEYNDLKHKHTDSMHNLSLTRKDNDLYKIIYENYKEETNKFSLLVKENLEKITQEKYCIEKDFLLYKEKVFKFTNRSNKQLIDINKDIEDIKMQFNNHLKCIGDITNQNKRELLSIIDTCLINIDNIPDLKKELEVRDMKIRKLKNRLKKYKNKKTKHLKKNTELDKYEIKNNEVANNTEVEIVDENNQMVKNDLNKNDKEVKGKSSPSESDIWECFK